MQPQVLIHIGMPKAASTTLQKHLFCNLRNAQNFGLYPTNNVAGDNEIGSYESAVYLRDRRLYFFYKALLNDAGVKLEELRESWRSIFADNYGSSFRSVLLSHEALTSCFFSSIDQREKARRLKALFPDAKILLIVRSQLDWLRSQYGDHPFDPVKIATGKAVSFDNWVSKFLHDDALQTARAGLRYADLVEIYTNFFGDGSVKVLLFEDILNRPRYFFANVALFLSEQEEVVASLLMGKHENRGLSGVYNALRQARRAGGDNTVIQKIMDMALRIAPLRQLSKKAAFISDANLEALREFYKNDNARLKKMVELRDYPYFCD